MDDDPVDRRQRNGAGPATMNVRQNLKRLRRIQEVTTEQLSRMLGEAGRPIQASAITKMETGDRRIDLDDLVTLAAVLNVTPSQLLQDDVRQPVAEPPAADQVVRLELTLRVV